MKVKASWLFAIAVWAYCIIGFILVYMKVAWINTFDFLLGVVVLLGLSIWYVIEMFRYRDPSRLRKSGWTIGPRGIVHRRRESPGQPITKDAKRPLLEAGSVDREGAITLKLQGLPRMSVPACVSKARANQ